MSGAGALPVPRCLSCAVYQDTLRGLQVEVEAAEGGEKERLRQDLIAATLMYGMHVMGGLCPPREEQR